MGSAKSYPGLVPTVLERTGGKQPATFTGMDVPPLPGKSLVPAFEKNGSAQHDSLWWCHDGHRAVRVGDHKLVAAKDEPWGLYDLATDRSETTDLAAEMPGRVGELEAAWSRIAEECRKLATDPDPAGPSESEGDRG